MQIHFHRRGAEDAEIAETEIFFSSVNSNFVYFRRRFGWVKEMLWLACGIVVVLSGFYVLASLFKESKGSLETELQGGTERDRLLDRKSVLQGNLKDLELEYAMGRLSDADFNNLSIGYRNEMAVILQRLDQLGGVQNPEDSTRKAPPFLESNLHGSGGEEAQGSSRCPSCSAKIIPGKKFCADCGHRF
jgi:hypothetical protein